MIVRNTLLYLSRLQWLRRWVEESRIGQRLTGRFIAGNQLEDGLQVCARLNAEGIFATLDHLGENVHSTEEGAGTRDAYCEALEAIAAQELQSTVSIKLTHFGLDLSEESCREFVDSIVAKACELGRSVEIDMESREYVDRTLGIVVDMHRKYGCVRAVIQAYLRRSEDDIRRLCREGIPVRICKGAYKEDASVAFPAKPEVDRNYLRLVSLLLSGGLNPAIATHDERIINQVIAKVREKNYPPEGLEFQMLYGVRKSLQRELASKGFRVRLYVPYGDAWYPYFMRRLAENPANLLFLARNFLR